MDLKQRRSDASTKNGFEDVLIHTSSHHDDNTEPQRDFVQKNLW